MDRYIGIDAHSASCTVAVGACEIDRRIFPYIQK